MGCPGGGSDQFDAALYWAVLLYWTALFDDEVERGERHDVLS